MNACKVSIKMLIIEVIILLAIIISSVILAPMYYPEYRQRCAEEGGEFANGMCYMTKPELPAYHK